MTFARPVYTPPPRPPLRPASRRAVYSRSDAGPVVIAKESAVRSEPYRRLVAALPCIACTLQGYSQAAHVPPDGRGLKQDDRQTFPLCATRPGIDGCHVRYDRWQMFPRAQAVEVGLQWAAQTRAAILACGLWPASLPKWGDS